MPPHGDDERFFARILLRGGDGLIEGERLGDQALAVVLLRCGGGERGIDHEHVAAAAALHELDRAPHHVRERWLLAAGFDLVAVGQRPRREDAHESVLAIRRGIFQLGLRAHDLAPFSPQLCEKVARVLALAAISRGLEIVPATAERDIELRMLGEHPREHLRLARIRVMRIKRGGGWRGEAAIRDEPHRAPLAAREFQDRRQRLAARVERERAMIHLHAGRERGGGGGGVRHGEIVRGIAHEREMREGLQREPMLRAAFIHAGRGEMPRDQPVADEEDDAERLAHHPGAHVEPAEHREHHQAEEREQLVAVFHRWRRGIERSRPCLGNAGK